MASAAAAGARDDKKDGSRVSQALRLHSRRTSHWDAKFRISKRAALSAIARLASQDRGPTWVAKFHEHKTGEEVTLRFKSQRQLAR